MLCGVKRTVCDPRDVRRAPGSTLRDCAAPQVRRRSQVDRPTDRPRLAGSLELPLPLPTIAQGKDIHIYIPPRE